jgi:hypothetical protein
MPKTVALSNYRVEIEPRSLGDFGYMSFSDRLITPNEKERQKEYKERCEEIVEQIKRHVDNVGGVYILCDTNNVCEFCGFEWTEEDPNYNGGCCTKDVEMFERSKTGEKT